MSGKSTRVLRLLAITIFALGVVTTGVWLSGETRQNGDTTRIHNDFRTDFHRNRRQKLA